MRVLLLTLGTRGDVQPFVALGAGLRRAGHAVTLATGAGFEALVAGHGLGFAPLRADFQALLATPEGQAALRSPLAALSAWRRLVPTVRSVLDDAWTAARACAPEVIVFHPKALAGIHLAEKLALPAIAALPALTPTRAFPSPLLPTSRDFGAWGNRLSHLAVLRAMGLPYRRVIDRWRAEALGLPPLPLLADRLRLPGEPVTRLYGVSRHLMPSPPDWDAGSVMTGAWFLDEGAGWTPPTGLAAFLAAGPPPVYVGFGSMAGPDAARLAAVALEALARAGQRAVLATGWGGLAPPPALPDGVHALEAAPHDRLFPRMAAVVHHGGAGTTHEGLRWGRPTVICPVFGDQPFWGRRVAALGAGPPPLPHRGLTPDRLAAAIRAAVENPAIGRRAAKLGALVRAEPGVARAVEVIEEVRRAAG